MTADINYFSPPLKFTTAPSLQGTKHLLPQLFLLRPNCTSCTYSLQESWVAPSEEHKGETTQNSLHRGLPETYSANKASLSGPQLGNVWCLLLSSPQPWGAPSCISCQKLFTTWQCKPIPWHYLPRCTFLFISDLCPELNSSFYPMLLFMESWSLPPITGAYNKYIRYSPYSSSKANQFLQAG